MSNPAALSGSGAVMAIPPAGEGKGKPRTIASGRRRNSCDFCTRRKRRCDGNTPCSFCIAKKQVCNYSVRLLTGPRADSASKRASKKSEVGRKGGVGSGPVSTGDRFSAVVSLKRARLSPSAATGLVGLRENVFIGEFFRTMGFLPFTTESFIRKAMVSTMFRTIQGRDPGIPGHSGGFYDNEEELGRREGAMVPTAGGRSGMWPEGEGGFATESKVESAAAACVLWSTVGMGCLVGGHPKSSVEGYVHLAREALVVCFDDGSIETARAFTAIALFQNFLGNTELYTKYIQFAQSIMKALPPEKVPQDLSDSHLFVKACDIVGTNEYLDEDVLRDVATTVENGYQSCTSMVEDAKVFQQAELCRWLLKTDIRMSACFKLDMYQQGAFDEHGITPLLGPASSGPGGDDGANNVNSGDGVLMVRAPHGMCQDGAAEKNATRNNCRHGSNMLDTASQPPPPGEMSRKFADEVSPECHLLLNTTQSPNVRGGVGELFFRGIMAYATVLQGGQDCAIDCLMRCGDIFLKSPGLCRFPAWTHLVHCVLACMEMCRFNSKYEELRNTYNSVIDEGDVRVPPMEEWRGMASICDHIFCRSLYRFLTTASPAGVPHDLPGDEAVPLTPSSIDGKAGMDTSSTFSVSGESWARGIFDERWQPTDPGGGEGQPSNGAPAAAAATACSIPTAPTAYPESGFVRALGGGSVPVVQQSGAQEVGAVTGFGSGAGPPAVSIATGSCSTTTSNIGPVQIGAGGSAPPAPARAPAAPPLPPPSEATANCVYRNAAPLPRLSSMPSPSAKLQTTAESNNSATGGEGAEGSGDLGLLNASEMEGAIDGLLGEGILEGFGEEVSGEEDMLPLLTEVFGDG